MPIHSRSLCICFVMAASLCYSVEGAIIGFGDFSTFTLNQLDNATPPAIFPPTAIQITNTSGNEVRSLFHNTRQDVSAFLATFTYREVGSSSTPIGVSFILHNSVSGLNAIGNNFNYYGFGINGIDKSVAISLEIGSSSANPQTFSGLYKNGFVGGGSAATDPVNLMSGHAIDVSLLYNGSILHETLVDTVTNDIFEKTYLVNIPGTVGDSLAYVGFTANTGNPSFHTSADQFISNFQFTAVPEPSAFLLTAMGGGAIIAVATLRRRRRTL